MQRELPDHEQELSGMAYTADDDAVLSAAIDGSPRVAAIIAELPQDQHPRAFDAAEQIYRDILEERNYPEDAATSWLTAMMHFLRAEVAKKAQACPNRNQCCRDQGRERRVKPIAPLALAFN
jgi:hypothetical protein